jgi:hypothetical protein
MATKERNFSPLEDLEDPSIEDLLPDDNLYRRDGGFWWGFRV